MSIDSFPLGQVGIVIKIRFNCVIEKWLKNSVARGKMEDAIGKVQSALTEIKLEFETIELDMTGLKPGSEFEEKMDIKKLFLFARLIINNSVFWYEDVLNIFKFHVLGVEGRKKRAKAIYQDMLKDFPREKLTEMFESLFGKQYSKTVAYIFEIEIPSKIKSMKTTNEQMLQEFFSLQSKQESYLNLNTMMRNLNSEIQNYKKTQMK